MTCSPREQISYRRLVRRSSVVRGCLAASLALTVAALPSVAEACRCRGPQTGLLRPPWPEASGLRLVDELIEIDCYEPSACRWRSVHTYARTQPGEPAEVPMVLPFAAYKWLEVRWDDRRVEPLVGEALDRATAWVQELDGADAPEGVVLWLADDGRQLTIELELEGEVYGEHFYSRDCCHRTALEVRHPFVASDAEADTWRWGEYESAAVSPDAHTRVRVNADRGLLVQAGRARHNAYRRGALSLDEPSSSGVGFEVIDPGRITGGPFIALGGAILDSNPVRGRIGWEHTYKYPYLYYSGALETDFTSDFTFVPAVEITHGRGLIFAMFPCVGFGVGLPVQFLPDPRPALRAQVSLSWTVFSILTTFDWLMQLPPTASGSERPHMLELAFLGQFSF